MTGDLFGSDAPGAAPSDGAVQLALILHDQSTKAWLLGESVDGRKAKWAPKSKVTRGEGRDANIWTMPRWVAVERGWL